MLRLPLALRRTTFFPFLSKTMCPNHTASEPSLPITTQRMTESSVENRKLRIASLTPKNDFDDKEEFIDTHCHILVKRKFPLRSKLIFFLDNT